MKSYVEVFDNLVLQRPLVTEFINVLPLASLGTADSDVILEAETERQRLIEQEVNRGLSAIIKAGEPNVVWW